MIDVPIPNNLGSPGAPDDEIVLKPVNIIHADGGRETAYVQDVAGEAQMHSRMQKLHKHLTIVYLTVGILALGLSAYATIKMLKK